MDAADAVSNDVIEAERERIFDLCRGKLRDESLADDVTQVVFEKYIGAHARAQIDNPAALLTSIAVNECNQAYRDRKRSKEVCANDMPEANSEDDPRDPFERAIDRASREASTSWEAIKPTPDPFLSASRPPQAYLDALSGLGVDQRLAWVICNDPGLKNEDVDNLFGSKLRKLVRRAKTLWPGGAPVAEAAALLGRKEGTVSAHIARARVKLKAAGMLKAELEKWVPRGGRSWKRVRTPALKPSEVASSHRSSPVRQIPVGSVEVVVPADPRPECPAGPVKDQNKALGRISYQCGCTFKRCKTCDSYEVRRSYKPKRTEWTFWCLTCGAKDADCWENCQDQIGKEPELRPKRKWYSDKRKSRSRAGR